MDSEFLRTNLQSDLRQGLKTVVNLFQELNLVNAGNQNTVNAFKSLQTLVGNDTPTIQAEIESFSFSVPAQTFQNLVAELGATHPKLGLHFTDRRGILHRNSHPASYNFIEPDVAGWAARDALQAAQPNATLPQLQDAYDAAKMNREGINRTVAQTAPIWTLLQRDSCNDIRQEDSLLIFLDHQHKSVDWYTVVKNLKRYGEPIGYNLDHYKRCLDRFVGFFAPALKPVTDELPAGELAKFLMRMTLPTPKFERLAMQIQSLVRNPAENLRNVLAQLQGMATAYYNDKPIAEQPALINRLMVTGLLSFTTGQTNKALSAALELSQLQGKNPAWLTLTESVMNSERIHGIPQVTLPFRAMLPPTTSLFTSTHFPVESPVHAPYTSVEYSLNPVDPFYSQVEYPNTTGHSQFPNVPQSPMNPMGPKPVTNPVGGIYAPAPVQGIMPMAHNIPQLLPNNPAVQSPPREQVQPNRPANMVPRPTRPVSRKSSRTKTQTKHYDASAGAYLNQSAYVETKSQSRPGSNQRRPNTDNRSQRPQQYNDQSRERSRSSGYDNKRFYTPNRESRPPTPNGYQITRPQSKSPMRTGYNTASSNQYRPRSPSPYRSNTQQRSGNNFRSPSYSNQSYSKGYSNQKPYTQHGNDRSRFQSPYRPPQNSSDDRPSRSPVRRDDSRSNQFNRPPSRPNQPQTSYNSRPRSQSASRFPGYLPGVNCSSDYHPWLVKHCMKCFTRNDHHECYCPKYYRFHNLICPKCNKGFHYAADCIPTTQMSNSRSPSRDNRDNQRPNSNRLN